MPNRLRLFAFAAALTVPLAGAAQNRLETMPGYDAAQRIAREAPGAITGGTSLVVWVDEGRAIEYDRDGQRYRYEIARRRAARIDAPSSGAGGRGAIAEASDRGRQAASTSSPDGTWKAFYKDHNFWISAADDSEQRPVTLDGSAAERIKYGTASWVYGEELSQRTAMWWSPDGRKIAYYRFDESACATTTSRSIRRAFRTRSTPRRIRRPARPTRPSTCSSTTSRRGSRSRIDVRDGQAFRRRGRRPLRLPRVVVAGRPRAALPAQQPAAERDGARRSQSGDRRVPRGLARGLADRLAQRPSRASSFLPMASASSGNRSATAGTTSISTISTGRLITPLTTHTEFEVGQAGQGRRDGRRPVLHGPRRRQLPEAAAASRRPRRHGTIAG